MAKPVPVFRGNVERGVLKLERDDLFRGHLHTLMGPVEVLIRKPRKPRSIQENSYYWGVVIKLIADEIGEGMEGELDAERVHRLMVNMFAVEDVGGLKIPKSTSDFSTVEMEDYLAQVRAWASSFLNVYIPMPNEIEGDPYGNLA